MNFVQFVESKKQKKIKKHPKTKKITYGIKDEEFIMVPRDLIPFFQDQKQNQEVTTYFISLVKKMGKEKRESFVTDLYGLKTGLLAIKGIPTEDLYKEEIIRRMAVKYKEYNLKEEDLVKLFNLINIKADEDDKKLQENLGSFNYEHEHLSLSDTQKNNAIIQEFKNLKPNVEDSVNFSYPGIEFEFKIKTREGKSAIVNMITPQVGKEYQGGYDDCLQFMKSACENWLKKNKNL